MRLATRSWGEEGRPLAVLVHGITGSSRTWWRVGPWFAEKGWHAIAVDLRGHGASPRKSGDEELEDLVEDLHETVNELFGSEERIDVLLGHSLGALTGLGFCKRYGERVWRLVLEEPPGSESIDFDEIAHGVEADVARAREDPDALKQDQLEENPSWAEEDAEMSVASMRDCDAGPVATLIRYGLRYDLPALVKSVETPTLLILGSEPKGSALLEPERTSVANALRHGTVEVFDASHGVHRDDFEGYVRLLGEWLGGPGR